MNGKKSLFVLGGINKNVYLLDSSLDVKNQVLANHVVNNLNLEKVAIIAPRTKEGIDEVDSFLKEMDRLNKEPVSIQWYENTDPIDLRDLFKNLREIAWEINAQDEYQEFLGVDINILDSMFDVEADEVYDIFDIQEDESIDSTKVILESIDGIFFPLADEGLTYVAAQVSLSNLQTQLLGNDLWLDLDFINQEKNLEIDQELIKKALEGVNKIGIWAGGGVQGISEEITKLSEHLNAPIFTSFAGRGVGGASKNYLTIPIHEVEAEQVLSQCEALLVFGSQLDGMNTKNWGINFPQKIIIFDANPSITLRNIRADLVVRTADLAKATQYLNTLPSREHWIDVAQISIAARQRIANSEKGRDGMALVAAIEKSWPIENYIVCDMAISGYWTGVYLQTKRVRQIAYPVGWGTLGFALPASLGPAANGTSTLVVCGDGGIAFGLGELATVAQEKLPVTILLHDDGGYGMLRFDQKVMSHPERGVNLFNPNWQLLAESFQIDFIKSNLENLAEVLQKRAASKTPGIVLIEDEIYPPKSTSPRWNEN